MSMLRKIWTKLRASVTGLSPETIALIFVLGLVLGVFPVFGVPTLLCSLAAIVFRVNLPAMQLVNQVCSPLQYALLIPLGRAGARIVTVGGDTTHAGVSGAFVSNILHTTGNAIVGWCCYCVPVGLALYLLITFALSRRERACFHELETPAW